MFKCIPLMVEWQCVATGVSQFLCFAPAQGCWPWSVVFDGVADLGCELPGAISSWSKLQVMPSSQSKLQAMPLFQSVLPSRPPSWSGVQSCLITLPDMLPSWSGAPGRLPSGSRVQLSLSGMLPSWSGLDGGASGSLSCSVGLFGDVHSGKAGCVPSCFIWTCCLSPDFMWNQCRQPMKMHGIVVGLWRLCIFAASLEGIGTVEGGFLELLEFVFCLACYNWTGRNSSKSPKLWFKR